MVVETWGNGNCKITRFYELFWLAFYGGMGLSYNNIICGENFEGVY